MSVTAPIFDKADPKSKQLFPYHLPLTQEWAEEKSFFGNTMMMGSGAGMFLKNPLIVYAALIISVITLVGSSPLRAPKDMQSPLMGIGLGLMGLITVNLPRLMS
ncbi:hypothetical protein BD324DRAFT_681488 [Kockovaella imperatae]|uniref:Uncharacterized protein n=1 Tax=Kockovaella imperatae TaxID=4999 RepID=A0A1Y1UF87_9TREE|nr:hypothetical protein BD324DRAFT_681488 [Kockovaella imperatae]ORX36720.1 hypothetical protein BD324DRAFT_681488 [Kockovaella imperatae]